MRRTILLAGVLLSVVALGSDSPKEYDDRAEVADIEGAWQWTEVSLNGRKENPPLEQVMICRSGTYTFKYSYGSAEGCYRIDLTRKPPHFDWILPDGPTKGKTIKCIYQIERDTLRIAAIAQFDGDRPKGFDDKGVIVWTYRRLK